MECNEELEVYCPLGFTALLCSSLLSVLRDVPFTEQTERTRQGNLLNSLPVEN